MCCCLQSCNSVVNIEVMGLVFGQKLIVIPSTGVLLYAKVSSLYNVLLECRLQINKSFDKLLQVGSSDPICL